MISNRSFGCGLSCRHVSQAQLLVGNDDLTGDVHDNAWRVDVANDTASVLWQNFPVWSMALRRRDQHRLRGA